MGDDGFRRMTAFDDCERIRLTVDIVDDDWAVRRVMDDHGL